MEKVTVILHSMCVLYIFKEDEIVLLNVGRKNMMFACGMKWKHRISKCAQYRNRGELPMRENGKAFKKAVQNYLAKIIHYSEEDCALDLLNRYLVLLQFDRDTFKCRLGAGWGIPVDLIIGPRFQISIVVENGRQPRHLAYFASVRQVIVTKVQIQGKECYQVRIGMEQSITAAPNNNNSQYDFISFTFTTPEEADTVVHLLEGYCGESMDDILSNGTLNSLNNHESKWQINSGITCSDFLPNGCPFRLCTTTKSQLQSKQSLFFAKLLNLLLPIVPNFDPLLVAVKTCKLDASYEERKRFLEEAHILGEFDHPHIIKLFGVCSDEPIWLVMEYAPLGELRHYLIAKQNELTITQLLTYSYQIVTALACLESKKCVHRDIAARNILVSRPDCVKLADFGMSLILTDKNDFQAEQGRKMPIKWMAPESLHQRRFSSASDVWMFGVCIWEILSKGVKPFSNLTNAEAVEQIARGVRLERPDKCPHSLYEILLQCWNANPTLRPTFSMLKPRIRELIVQYKSTSASLEPVYLNCVGVDNQNDQSDRTYQNQFRINLTPPKPPKQSTIQPPKPYMSLQSRWDEASKVNWTKLDIPSGRYLPNNLEKSYKTMSNSPSPSRLVDIDLNSNPQRDIPSFHGMKKHSATRNASTSSVNSSTLGSVSSTVTVKGQSPDTNRPKSILSPPVCHNTMKIFDFTSESRKSTERRSDDFEKRYKSELRRNTSIYRKTMPPSLATQVINLSINENNNSTTSVESCSLSHNTHKVRSFSSDGVRLASHQKTPTLSRNESISQSMSQHSSNQSIKVPNSPTRNILINHNSNNDNSCIRKHTASDFSSNRQASSSKRNNNDDNNTGHVDPVFSATVKVVQTVSLVSQQIITSKPEEYGTLIKTIGTSIKDLFSAIQNEFGDHACETILLAERQLNSSMYSLITTTKSAKLQNNRGPLLEEYRRHLMSLAYAIAADANSLYTTVYENRSK
ncbi:tyrosine kinase [Schistosoma mansoni]|uniref:tyrosine kinase n=1 Tax=Schistosoma mansoni TaxID=6183 RepID=UPI0001A635E9|nr:tyrosine kinase [Schistosoma mansoni]|eukprot:XP_018653840.1 tyrosine kinase [Schistosoma mansoni]